MALSYTKTVYVNDTVPPIDAVDLGNIEEQVKALSDAIADTDGTLGGATPSSTLTPCQAAVQTYVQTMTGDSVDGVSSWSAATEYTVKGAAVMRYGMQFVNLSSSNTNHDPILEPTYWLAVPDKRGLLAASHSGRVILGDSSPVHDFNNAAYVQYLSLGLHNFGGSSGVDYNAYLVHLDGQAIGSGALSTIVETWHLKNIWMPGSTGSRTAKDARGKVPRGIDVTGGQADEMGEILTDQVQGHIHEQKVPNTAGSSSLWGFEFWSTRTLSAIVDSTLPAIGSPIADGTNGTPRVGLKTRDQSYTVGVPYVVILVAA